MDSVKINYVIFFKKFDHGTNIIRVKSQINK